MTDTLQILPTQSELHRILRSEQKEYHQNLYSYRYSLLEADRWGYAVYDPVIDIDFADIESDSGDSIREFERLLNKAIDEGDFQIHDFKKAKFVGSKINIQFAIESITIGPGREELGSKEDRLYFVIKLGKRI